MQILHHYEFSGYIEILFIIKVKKLEEKKYR
jgi:hypothetical protein